MATRSLALLLCGALLLSSCATLVPLDPAYGAGPPAETIRARVKPGNTVVVNIPGRADYAVRVSSVEEHALITTAGLRIPYDHIGSIMLQKQDWKRAAVITAFVGACIGGMYVFLWATGGPLRNPSGL
jgi:hypothetical protein